MARKNKQLDPPEQVGCPWCGDGFITFALKRKAGVTVSARLVCFTCRAQGPTAPTLNEARVKWETRASSTNNTQLKERNNERDTTNGTAGEENEQPVAQARQAAPAQPGGEGVELPVQVPGREDAQRDRNAQSPTD